MKLSRLYSNSEKFRTIEFNDGLNVVVGRIINHDDLNSNSHNLGKSTLIYLLDFLFLKDLQRGHFLKDNYEKFENHIFFLELKLQSDYYVTIRREVKNNTKISMKIHNEGKRDFRYESDWDYKDLPLGSHYTDKNPKSILNNLLHFRDTYPYSYRTYISYLLRTQYDYDAVFKLSKYRGGDVTWKPAVATLLGFDGSLLSDKYELESNIRNEENLLAKMEQELKVSLNDLNRIQALIEANEKKKNNIVSKIDNFDFYLQEKELNKDLIESIESQISKYNTEQYKIQYEIQVIKDSLNSQRKFNLEAVDELFREAKIYFSTQLKKDYQDLVEFNKKITVERDKYLEQNLQKYEKRVEYVGLKLEDLNKKRNDILSVLKEKDSFSKFKKYQMELIEIENEISQLLSKLDNLEALKTIVDRKTQFVKNLNQLIAKIYDHFKNSNTLFKQIQLTFTDLADDILDETAILFYTINTADNVEFDAKITSIEENQLTSKSDGFSYRKMLCICFDLSIILNYLNKDFFRFIYHDGSLESLSDTKKITYMNTITELCEKKNIQYIFTAIEDDLPRNPDGSLYKITAKDIILTLDDRENHAGRLFGFDF